LAQLVIHQSINVLDLFAAVNLFLRDNPDEFVILDFHQFKDGQQLFDYARQGTGAAHHERVEDATSPYQLVVTVRHKLLKGWRPRRYP